jgi:hypothetical protein
MVTHAFYVQIYFNICLKIINVSAGLQLLWNLKTLESSLNGLLLVMNIHLNIMVIVGSTREGLMRAQPLIMV